MRTQDSWAAPQAQHALLGLEHDVHATPNHSEPHLGKILTCSNPVLTTAWPQHGGYHAGIGHSSCKLMGSGIAPSLRQCQSQPEQLSETHRMEGPLRDPRQDQNSQLRAGCLGAPSQLPSGRGR